MKNIKYHVHYIFDDLNELDCIFISNDMTAFCPEENIITFNPQQFETFMNTVKNVSVQWSSDIILLSDIK